MKTFAQHTLECSACASKPWAACRTGYALIFGEMMADEFRGGVPEHGGKVELAVLEDAVASKSTTRPNPVEAGSAMVHLDADGLATYAPTD